MLASKARRASLALACALASTSCSLAFPLDGYHQSAADAGSGGDGAAGSDDGCAAGRGARQVRAGTFCVDATEVTQSEYAAFLAASPSTSGQTATCAGNASFAVGEPEGPGGCGPDFFKPSTQGDRPVVCVDWCDAAAYCAWAGKRLCGHIDGGALGFDESIDPAKSQWMSACSRRGARAYPYGNAYLPGACNAGAAGGAPVSAGSLASCVGGYDGLFDMSGNVWEWEDACEPGAAGGPARCRLRGGSHAETTGEKLRCDGSGSPNAQETSFAGGNVGFRCCSP